MIPKPSTPGFRAREEPDGSTIAYDANGKLAMVGAAYGPDNVTLEQSGGKQQIKDDGVTGAKLGTGILHVTLADGSASQVNVAVSGMTSADELVSVLAMANKASIATMLDHTSDYSGCGSGAIVKTGTTNETGNLLQIIWLKKH